eukprot:gene4200-11413_t
MAVFMHAWLDDRMEMECIPAVRLEADSQQVAAAVEERCLRPLPAAASSITVLIQPLLPVGECRAALRDARVVRDATYEESVRDVVATVAREAAADNAGAVPDLLRVDLLRESWGADLLGRYLQRAKKVACDMLVDKALGTPAPAGGGGGEEGSDGGGGPAG